MELIICAMVVVAFPVDEETNADESSFHLGVLTMACPLKKNVFANLSWRV